MPVCKGRNFGLKRMLFPLSIDLDKGQKYNDKICLKSAFSSHIRHMVFQRCKESSALCLCLFCGCMYVSVTFILLAMFRDNFNRHML